MLIRFVALESFEMSTSVIAHNPPR